MANNLPLINLSKWTLPILLVENQTVDTNKFLKDCLKTMVCESKEPGFCNQCDYCKKIEVNNYYDCFFFDANVGKVLKRELIHMMRQFNSQGLEAPNKKFCVIRHAQNLSPECANVLLKFLEEPLDDVYVLLTTNNLNAVLPTISSRCRIEIIRNDNKAFKQFVDSYHLDDKQVECLKACCSSIDEMTSYLNDKLFATDYQMIQQMMQPNNLSLMAHQLHFIWKVDTWRMQKIILMTGVFLPNAKEDLMRLWQKTHSELVKTLVLNKLWQIIKKHITYQSQLGNK